MSPSLRIINRTVRRDLQQHNSFSRFLSDRSPVLFSSWASLPKPSQAPLKKPLTLKSFTTMALLSSNAPRVTTSREFDPEIRDMASYVHNYKVDSDLAVRYIMNCSRIHAVDLIDI